MEARLTDLANKVLWQGTATAELIPGLDRFKVLSVLSQRLAELVGTDDTVQHMAPSDFE